jgi:hypothetical protein
MWRTPLVVALGQTFVGPVVGAACRWLIYAAFNDLLGANPAEALIRQRVTGLCAVCVVLAVTPLRDHRTTCC